MNTFIFSEVSIDGKMTIKRGLSSRFLLDLLSEDDFRLIHSYREKSDGIMVGKKTVDIDNPNLTNRYSGEKQPIRIIPSNSLDFDYDSNIFNQQSPTIIVTSEKNRDHINVKEILGYGVEVLFFGKDTVDFSALFSYLEKERNFKNLMIEGGGTLNYELLKSGLIDEIIMLQIPIIIGGRDNVTLIDGSEFYDMHQETNFALSEASPMGNFLLLKYDRKEVMVNG